MIKNKKHCTMILLAGGQGKRMGTKIAKQYINLGDKPLLWHSLMAAEKSEIIDEVILVIRPNDIEYIKDELLCKYSFSKVTRIADAGKERYESVWSGLVSLRGYNWMAFTEEKKRELLEDETTVDMLPTDYVFIHDGARPFLNEDIISRCYKGVSEYGACVAAVKTKDTVKIVNDEGEIINTPNRNNVWNMQTPQVFNASLIYEAYRKVIDDESIAITDDAQAVEITGLGKVHVVEGDYNNIKVTTPDDLVYAERLI